MRAQPKMNEQNIELGNSLLAQFYNLADDIGETKNLAKKIPSKLKELVTLLENIRTSNTGKNN